MLSAHDYLFKGPRACNELLISSIYNLISMELNFVAESLNRVGFIYQIESDMVYML